MKKGSGRPWLHWCLQLAQLHSAMRRITVIALVFLQAPSISCLKVLSFEELNFPEVDSGQYYHLADNLGRFQKRKVLNFSAMGRRGVQKIFFFFPFETSLRPGTAQQFSGLFVSPNQPTRELFITCLMRGRANSPLLNTSWRSPLILPCSSMV